MPSSSSDDDQDSAIQIAFVTVDGGQRSGIRERRLVVIKTEEEWRSLWARHTSTVSPAPMAAAVDFGRDMIIAVFSGEKSTGGYKIEIRKIEEDGASGRVSVFYHETQPPPGSVVIQAMTQPYHMIRLRKVDFTIDFVAA